MTCVFFADSTLLASEHHEQLIRQAQGLNEQGFRSRVLGRPGSELSLSCVKAGLAFEPVPFLSFAHPTSVWRVSRLLRRHKPVAIICYGEMDSALMALSVRALAGLKCLRYRPRLIYMQKGQTDSVRPYFYNQVFDITLVPSHALRDQLLNGRAIQPSRVAVLHPGVDFDAIARAAVPMPAPPLDQLLSNPNKRPLIFHRAPFGVEKGHDFMLDVVDSLLAEFPGLTYLAVGEGEMRETFQREVQRRGLSDHVLILAALGQPASVLARADVLVMPSAHESLGKAPIEALSLAIPVVVSNVGGLPETVLDGQTGFVCPPPFEKGAVDQWATVLRGIFSAPQNSKQMARTGSFAVRKQFGWASHLAGLIEQFNPPRLKSH
ncbi:MAG TPA: glycosyltransferase family 4 protein [Limnobacter sp.]|nr:glycosyltransferase family 4 protein [Limnobacter sp.]